ncbi:hypothetical protein [Gloeothece verrucosa]|uniref:Uncharacterized protein n=1 Tax=Gloeothece verrucosa (strain PCC 7822) TaxID=497965 RepID=E0UB58_GLOV7|nr:hypothetical protein [Gloeothece verrucosa]ADN16303.1 conserved hypothetical protein [Gloeothece verrucosa PCC 7822]
MSSQWLFVNPVLAQTSTELATSSPISVSSVNPSGAKAWMYSTSALALVLIAVVVYGKLKIIKAEKALKFEQFKTKDLKKKLKLALVTIKKMESNPDLVHSRAFNLDYLRMRMDEEVFHYVIVNQIKMKITQLIGEALRPSTDKNMAGVVPGSRKIDENFDVTYEVETGEGKWNKGVLFRIQIKLTKLPTQTSSTTVNEIIECVEVFLSANSEHENWQPAIHGHVVLMQWDQKARPTPLLVLEQSEEGVNVSYRSTPARMPTAPVSEKIAE